MSAIEAAQRSTCASFRADWTPAPFNLKAGVALNVESQLKPVNGLRQPPKGDTTGWYIWAGQVLSDEPDFFQPLHVSHLTDWRPEILKYLGLPPGYRFLLAENYQDVWFDASLLDVD